MIFAHLNAIFQSSIERCAHYKSIKLNPKEKPLVYRWVGWKILLGFEVSGSTYLISKALSTHHTRNRAYTTKYTIAI